MASGSRTETSINAELFLGAKPQICGIEIRVCVGQADLDGVLIRMEMTALKQRLFFMTMRMPGSDDVRGAMVAFCHYCQADDSCMTAGHGDIHRAMFGGEGCYKVSPSHTHKQDTITDTQRGCPFV